MEETANLISLIITLLVVGVIVYACLDNEDPIKKRVNKIAGMFLQTLIQPPDNEYIDDFMPEKRYTPEDTVSNKLDINTASLKEILELPLVTR